jgi:hypothetical protein
MRHAPLASPSPNPNLFAKRKSDTLDSTKKMFDRAIPLMAQISAGPKKSNSTKARFPTTESKIFKPFAAARMTRGHKGRKAIW